MQSLTLFKFKESYDFNKEKIIEDLAIKIINSSNYEKRLGDMVHILSILPDVIINQLLIYNFKLLQNNAIETINYPSK